jgi:hypothetical protein
VSNGLTQDGRRLFTRLDRRPGNSGGLFNRIAGWASKSGLRISLEQADCGRHAFKEKMFADILEV